MGSDAADLPRDADALIALLLRERAAHANVRAEFAAQLATRDDRLATSALALDKSQQRIAELQHEIDYLSKHAFGQRSDKLRAEVPELIRGKDWLPFAEFLDAAQRVADRHGVHGTVELAAAQSDDAKAPEAQQPARCSSGHGRRAEFPAHLPVVTSRFELPESARQCCGKPMQSMGVEETRELERIEMAVVHVIAREKYCCRTCQMQVLVAPGPTRPIERGILGSGWLSHLVVDRFGYHMPYHRLEQKYATEGLDLSRSVLCRSSIEVLELLEQVFEAHCKVALSEDVLFADETPAVVQKAKNGKRKKAQLWLYSNKRGERVFDYSESRGRESPMRMLGDFEGRLHDDGYKVYEVAFDPAKVKHVACWAHVRRKFVNAQRSDRKLAKEAVDLIAELYAIDGAVRDRAQAEKRAVEPSELYEARREKSPAVLARIREWLEVRARQVLPQSPLGKAIKYALGRWNALNTFLEDGRLELDNNHSERGVRPLALGRKNWMMIGNERGGRAAAIAYSLIGTCKSLGVDPKLYLHDVMLRVKEGEDPKTLTPREWKVRHAASVKDRRDYVLAGLIKQAKAK